MSDEILVSSGGEVKSLGSRRIGGYAVLFSGPNDPDQVGEYFDRECDFWLESETASRRRLLWDHGRSKSLKTQKLADVTLHLEPRGLWAESEFKRMDETQERILAMVNRGELGFSTGSSAHLVERETVSPTVKAIRSWPISEVSVTSTPCEPRCVVQSLKSLAVTDFDSLTKSQEYYKAKAAQICANLIAMDLEMTMQEIKPLTPAQRAFNSRLELELAEFERLARRT